MKEITKGIEINLREIYPSHTKDEGIQQTVEGTEGIYKEVKASNSFYELLNHVRLALATHDEKIKSEAEQKALSDRKIKESLSDYISDVFNSLKASETVNRKKATWLYVLSGLFLFTPCILAVFFIFVFSATTDSTRFFSIIGGLLFISILLVSISRLTFTLAKSYMVESIRCSDRIHAISFGRFFLDAYGDNATSDEVINAFSSWNIDNGGTVFRTQSSDDYAPQLIEIIKLLKK